MTQEVKQQSEEEKSLSSFTSRAMRRPKTGSYEQLLCQHLITSVGAYPIEKIRLIAEAAYMVPDSPVDQEALEVIYSIVISFKQTEVKINDPERFPGNISWSFDTNNMENYDKYIFPWYGDDVILSTNAGRDIFTNSVYDKVEDPRKQFFLLTTNHCLWITSLEQIKARFVKWAVPQVMVMFEQLSKMVNPNLYMDMLDRVKI